MERTTVSSTSTLIATGLLIGDWSRGAVLERGERGGGFTAEPLVAEGLAMRIASQQHSQRAKTAPKDHVQLACCCKPQDVMGITGLTAFLHEYYHRTWSQVNIVPSTDSEPKYDHVFIDANSLLYNNNKANVATFLRRLTAEIDRVLNWTGPPKTVYIALDGPGSI